MKIGALGPYAKPPPYLLFAIYNTGTRHQGPYAVATSAPTIATGGPVLPRCQTFDGLMVPVLLLTGHF